MASPATLQGQEVRASRQWLQDSVLGSVLAELPGYLRAMLSSRQQHWRYAFTISCIAIARHARRTSKHSIAELIGKRSREDAIAIAYLDDRNPHAGKAMSCSSVRQPSRWLVSIHMSQMGSEGHTLTCFSVNGPAEPSAQAGTVLSGSCTSQRA